MERSRMTDTWEEGSRYERYIGRWSRQVTPAFRDAAASLDSTAARLDEGARFTDFEDYWEPFLGSQGPAPTYVTSLEEVARERLPRASDGTISLVARAWAVRGRV